jgi:hypothetical protein
MYVIVTLEGEIFVFHPQFLGGFQLLFLMHVVGMSTQDKNPEVFSSTKYFTKFLNGVAKSLPNANSVR